MILAVAASGKWLDSIVDNHTGRAACFVLYDTEHESHEVIDNLHCTGWSHWAGSLTARRLVGAGVQAVIVHRIGPVAFRYLVNSSIDVFYVDKIPVVNAIRRFREGGMSPAERPNCRGHAHLHQ